MIQLDIHPENQIATKPSAAPILRNVTTAETMNDIMPDTTKLNAMCA
nr:hypothetical protein [Sulfitobacter algicola]